MSCFPIEFVVVLVDVDSEAFSAELSQIGVVALGGGADHTRPCSRPICTVILPTASGCPMHKQNVVRADLKPVQAALRGQPRQRQAPSLVPVDRGSFARDRHRRHRDVFGERPRLHDVLASLGRHLVPGRELRPVETERPYHPGDLPPVSSRTTRTSRDLPRPAYRGGYRALDAARACAPRAPSRARGRDASAALYCAMTVVRRLGDRMRDPSMDHNPTTTDAHVRSQELATDRPAGS